MKTDSSEAEEDETEAEDDIEIVATKDGKKIKIDYSDRNSIKRAHLLAKQGRTWQAERDNAIKERDELKTYGADRDEVLQALEDAKDDIPELYRLITGGEDWEAMIENEIRQREEIAQLTPEQLEVYNKHKLNERRDPRTGAARSRVGKKVTGSRRNQNKSR